MVAWGMSKFSPGVNDLATTHPEVAAEAYGWDPTTVSYGMAAKMSWLCPRDHQYTMSLNARTSLGYGCPYCSGKRVLAGFNDLATTHPELAREAYHWNPTTVSGGSHKKVLWRSSCGHVWVASIGSRTNMQSGCPFCAGQKTLPGFNDLETINPLLAAQLMDADPSMTSPGSNKRHLWKCDLGHVWSAAPSSRTRGRGCPFCSGVKVWAGFNDLNTTNPDLAREANGWDATSVSRGSNAKRSWLCESGHPPYFARVSSRAIAGTGCPRCAEYGYYPHRPGYLYLARHELRGMLQFGITNNPEERTRTHSRKGWTILDVVGPVDGLHVQRQETLIRGALANMGVNLYSKETQMPSPIGESWMESEFSASEVDTLIELC